MFPPYHFPTIPYHFPTISVCTISDAGQVCKHFVNCRTPPPLDTPFDAAHEGREYGVPPQPIKKTRGGTKGGANGVGEGGRGVGEGNEMGGSGGDGSKETLAQVEAEVDVEEAKAKCAWHSSIVSMVKVNMVRKRRALRLKRCYPCFIRQQQYVLKHTKRS